MTLEDFLYEWHGDGQYISVHTSGSTGQPKSMLVEKSRMLASARITCDFLGLKPGDSALLCMSLDYIAGKMMVVRSIERGLKLISVTPSNHPLAGIDSPIDFAAMVPSQIFGSLQVPAEREKLRQIRQLIIGGGAIPQDVESQLRSFPNAVWSTYGMTETLSHIALRRISGKDASQWYSPFRGVELSLFNGQGNIGQLVINAPHVCQERLITNDIVEIRQDNTDKQFRIIGRTDNVICSGGIKLHIEEIEEQLRPHLPMPFCISKKEDEKFGEVAVLLIEHQSSAASECKEPILDICRKTLPAYSVPKEIICVGQIPLTGTGKIDRATAQNLAKKH